MNARKLLLGGLSAMLLGVGFASTSQAGILQNDAKQPIYIRAGYWDSQTGFSWGAPTLLQPGAAIQVEDGARVFVNWQNLNGTWAPAHQLGNGAARDYLFISGSQVYCDVTRR